MYDLYCGSSNSLSVGIIAQRRFIVASNIQSNVVYYYEKLFQASLKTLEYVGPLNWLYAFIMSYSVTYNEIGK